MVVRFENDAEVELYEVIEYYNQIDTALAQNFLDELNNSVDFIIKYPLAGHSYLHNTQKVQLKKFPYSVVYKVYDQKRILIFAIKHSKRERGYWVERLE